MKLHGPGTYDAEALELLERLHAKGIALMVYDGDKGHGLAAKGDMAFMLTLPAILESLAKKVREDLAKDR